MNRRKLLSLFGLSPTLLLETRAADAESKSSRTRVASEPKLTAISPKGTPPPARLYSMAARSNSLNGKTIYLIDATHFDGSETLLMKMQAWFQQNVPSVKAVFRQKSGQYAADDPRLWAEIKANAYAAVMAIGH
jgi:hypothetical protein